MFEKNEKRTKVESFLWKISATLKYPLTIV